MLALTPVEVGASPIISSLPLFTPSQIEARRYELPVLAGVLDWVRGYLSQPHPELGRNGSVCPYVPMAMRMETLWFTQVCTPQGIDKGEMERLLTHYCEIFLKLDPTEPEQAINKAILVAFPDIPTEQAPELIDEVQFALKPHYTQAGLMIGEFHEKNSSPGLRNTTFLPLRSPIPLLAIRHMVKPDLPFLMKETDPPQARLHFLKSYLRQMSKELPEGTFDQVIDALVQAKMELKAEETTGCPFHASLATN